MIEKTAGPYREYMGQGREPNAKRLSNTPGVFVTVLAPVEQEAVMTDMWCSRDYSGRIEVEDVPIRVLDL